MKTIVALSLLFFSLFASAQPQCPDLSGTYKLVSLENDCSDIERYGKSNGSFTYVMRETHDNFHFIRQGRQLKITQTLCSELELIEHDFRPQILSLDPQKIVAHEKQKSTSLSWDKNGFDFSFSIVRNRFGIFGPWKEIRNTRISMHKDENGHLLWSWKEDKTDSTMFDGKVMSSHGGSCLFRAL